MKCFRLLSMIGAVACVGLSACSKSDDSDSSSAESSQLLLQFKTSAKPSASLALAPSETDFRNSAIAAGRPDSLTIYIKRMALEGANGANIIFSDTAGKAIIVKDKTVDISDLFTTYACIDNATGTPVEGVGECPCGLDADKKPVAKDATTNSCPDTGSAPTASVPATAGTYTKLSVEFSVRAKVKGCVTGNFSTVGSNGAATQGAHTYCTKASASTFQATPGVSTASELEGITAEEMDYQLPKANQLYSSASDTFKMEFTISGGVTLTEGGTSPLMSMVIDTNRMLRFYNKNQTKSPNPGMSDSRAYFFNTVFEESAFVFVGGAGEVRGFKWWTDACKPYTSGTACSAGSSSNVAGWMTVIKDVNGSPIVLGLMPDDDNSLTIVKGSNKSAEGLKSAAFQKTGSNYNLTYSLGTEGTGQILDVNLDADFGTTQTKNFSGLQEYGGSIYLKRGL
jgi:hypothetical protein